LFLKAVVFANGILSDPQKSLSYIRPDDILIAADGGAAHCQALGLTPDVVIGDFDSLEPGQLESLKASGAEIIRHPARKDFTDLELALEHAKNIGATQILVMAALGNRWDQTLANLLLPAAKSFSSVDIRLIDGPQEILLVKTGQKVVIHGRAGDIFSLIPLYGDARGITTQGLEYPLENGTLLFGSTRGISNVLVGDKAEIILQEGLLIGVLIHLFEKLDIINGARGNEP
jgi:thiamine pyrophosphokinase